MQATLDYRQLEEPAKQLCAKNVPTPDYNPALSDEGGTEGSGKQ